MTRDELVAALRGILGHAGTIAEDRTLAQIDAYVAGTARRAILTLAADFDDIGYTHAAALAREAAESPGTRL